MTMHVIGTGVGRTGTYSLKLALEQLGFGPCHHMEEVLRNMPTQVPLWSSALSGRPDWQAIYDGYASAVDWPTAGFFRELHQAYPDARFVLTHRSPETWADSFGSTIHALLSKIDEVPAEMRGWLEMASAVIERTGFPPDLDRDGLIKAFVAHNESVQRTIPKDRLLVFEAREGWEPLCDFLGVPVPSGPFPRANSRTEFWDHFAGKA